jgi:hypothetical protein
MIFVVISGINMLITFKQYSYAIHAITNPLEGTTLQHDPLNGTSNQPLSGHEDERSTSLSFWVDICQAIGGIATVGALIFIGFQTLLTQKQIAQTREEIALAKSGFFKLDLECSYEENEGKKYIVSKTLLKNTSRNPTIVVNAFLLIADQFVFFDEGIDIVTKEINNKKLGIIDQSRESVLANKLKTIVRSEYLAENDNIFHIPGKCTIISLPYYFETLVKLGSFAHNASTHIQSVTARKVYSVYFAVFGEDWYPKRDTSQGRVVHDEVLVK